MCWEDVRFRRWPESKSPSTEPLLPSPQPAVYSLDADLAVDEFTGQCLRSVSKLLRIHKDTGNSEHKRPEWDYWTQQTWMGIVNTKDLNGTSEHNRTDWMGLVNTTDWMGLVNTTDWTGLVNTKDLNGTSEHNRTDWMGIVNTSDLWRTVTECD